MNAALNRTFFALLFLALFLTGCNRRAATDTAPEAAEAALVEEPVDCAARHPDAVALVDCGPVMSSEELASQLADMVERYERLPEREPTSAAWRDERRRRLIRNAVQEALIALHVEGRGLQISDEEVSAHLREDLEHVFEDERLFERFLLSHEKTREEYYDEIRQEMAVDRVLAERGQLEPTEEEVQTFYDENRERWREDERVHARVITIRLRQNATDEQVDAARARIAALRARVTGSEDFAEVARADSESADRVRGGDRGWIVRGRRQQLIDDGVEPVLFSDPVGSITEPLRTQLGFQIYQILDRRPAGFRDLDEVQEILYEPLRRRNRDRLARELENELVQAADIVYLEERWGLEDAPEPAEGSAAGATE